MRRHDLTNKKTLTNTKTMRKTKTKRMTKTLKENTLTEGPNGLVPFEPFNQTDMTICEVL